MPVGLMLHVGATDTTDTTDIDTTDTIDMIDVDTIDVDTIDAIDVIGATDRRPKLCFKSLLPQLLPQRLCIGLGNQSKF